MCNYSLYRKDRDAHGGDIMVFIKSILPHRMRNNLSGIISNNVEGMVFECTMGKNKWLINAMYKPPSVNDNDFEKTFITLHEALFIESRYVVTIGDLNYDMNDRKNKLYNLCTLFGMKNIINENTCNKGVSGTSLDVILVSNKYSFLETMVSDIGVSDHHSLIGCSMRTHVPC